MAHSRRNLLSKREFLACSCE